LKFRIFLKKSESSCNTPDHEFLVDCHGLVDLYLASLLVLGGVVGLAEGGMTRTGVVPLVGSLLGDTVVLLDELDLPVGLQELEHDSDSGAHDAATDDERIDLLHVLVVLELHLWLHGIVATAQSSTKHERSTEELCSTAEHGPPRRRGGHGAPHRTSDAALKSGAQHCR
jgi:hypothetical protein